MPSKSERDDEPESTSEPELGLASKLKPIQKLKHFTKYFKKSQPKKQSKSELIESVKQETSVEPHTEIEKPEPTIKKTESHIVKSLLRPENEPKIKFGPAYRSEEFLSERIFTSNDFFGKKKMKIKVLEVSDEHSPRQWKFGDRVKVNKILVTITHLESSEIEEAEFNIEAIEKELIEKRHYSSSNRWVPTDEIKNGYVPNSRHISLISDAFALEYIAF